MSKFLSSAENAEIEQLNAAYVATAQRAAAAIASRSQEDFLQAEREQAEIVRRIKELLGTTNRHWMS